MKMGKRKRSGSFSKVDDVALKKSDPEDSQEELDENVAINAKGNTGGVRCSARVQEKQEKLRRESSPSKQILPLEVNCTATAGGNSISTLSKNSTKFPSPTNDRLYAGSEGASMNLPVGGLEEKRKKRTWELWSMEDKQLFFEALNEYGKDFDAIQTYIANKLKSKKVGAAGGQYAGKNKDQVRHFYYRTWNKITKHLKFPGGMKKANQELYGLINYGELRKKQRILNLKSASKLCELVENGMTSIKLKGKTHRIKTPVCRALKRLNGLEDIEHTRVPHKICLEIIPKDGKTWKSVQYVSHNPRVKIITGLQRTFASIITYLEHKWKGKVNLLKEQFSSVFGTTKARLCLAPAERRDFCIPFYRVAENTNSATICLRAYKKNVLLCTEDEVFSKIKRKRKQSGGANGMISTHDAGQSSTSKPVENRSTIDFHVDPETSDAESQSAVIDSVIPTSSTEVPLFVDTSAGNSEIFSRNLQSVQNYDPLKELENPYPLEDNQVDDINQTNETDNDEAEHDVDEAVEKFEESGAIKAETFVSHAWDEEQIRRGWTAEDAGVMTIGEVYFMVGQADKLSLEYSWKFQENTEDSSCHNLLERLITTATLLRRKKTARAKFSAANLATGLTTKCCKCGNNVEVTPSTSGVPKISPVTKMTTPLSRNRANTSFVNMTGSCYTVASTKKIGSPLPISSTKVSPEYPSPNGLEYIPNKYVELDLTYSAKELASYSSKTDSKSSALTVISKLSPPATATSSEGIIDITSIANGIFKDPNLSISPNIKATLLPPTSCMVRNASGTISVVSQVQEIQEHITFHRPSQLRPLEPVASENSEFPPPKPFLDLPKGNRRLGRRPNFKRVVIPRVLPLLPKNQTLLSPSSSTTGTSSAKLSPAIPVVHVNLGSPEVKDVVSGDSMQSIPTTLSGGNSHLTFLNQKDLPRNETAHYEMFLNADATNLSCNSNDFEDLLKLRRNENSNLHTDVDSLSLSSFMEISLPESAKMVATECMSMDEFEVANYSLGSIEKDKGLTTPGSSPTKRLQMSGTGIGTDLLPDYEKSWSMDAGDLSLSNFFLEGHKTSSEAPHTGTEVNFQAILNDGSLDFASKLTQLSSTTSENTK